MTVYYAVVKGDPLDSGGNSQVIGGNPHSTIQGPDGHHREQACLGHHAWCAACQSVGVIVAGADISDYLRGWDGAIGAHDAVGGDLVICKCERHPRVQAVYGRRCEYIDSPDASPFLYQGDIAGRPASENGDSYWIKFRLQEPGCYQGLRCIAHFSDGSSESGTFDLRNTVQFSRADNSSACHRIELVQDYDATQTGSVTESILSMIAR